MRPIRSQVAPHASHVRSIWLPEALEAPLLLDEHEMVSRRLEAQDECEHDGRGGKRRDAEKDERARARRGARQARG